MNLVSHIKVQYLSDSGFSWAYLVCSIMSIHWYNACFVIHYESNFGLLVNRLFGGEL